MGTYFYSRGWKRIYVSAFYNSNIVVLVDRFAAGRQQAIVMEEAPGGSLIKHSLPANFISGTYVLHPSRLRRFRVFVSQTSLYCRGRATKAKMIAYEAGNCSSSIRGTYNPNIITPGTASEYPLRSSCWPGRIP